MPRNSTLSNKSEDVGCGETGLHYNIPCIHSCSGLLQYRMLSHESQLVAFHVVQQDRAVHVLLMPYPLVDIYSLAMTMYSMRAPPSVSDPSPISVFTIQLLGI